MVGLYGDPDTQWGIGVEAGLARAVEPEAVERGLRSIAERYPHLGGTGPVAVAPAEGWDEARARTLAEPFLAGQPLVRATLVPSSASSGPRLLVTAHHGVCDGLGLLALVGAAIGTPVTPTATGLGSRPPRGSFLATLPQRVGEALRSPPPRFPTLTGPDAEPGEVAVVRTVARGKVGTVDLCRAVARVYRDRSGRDGTAALPLLFVGASRRPPGTVAPDRQTAYLRFRVDPRWTDEEAAAAFAALAPEPDFPETSLRGLGPRLVRPLRNRLGSTAMVSNLGVLDGDVEWLAMFPALSGPAAVSLGLATTATHTTLSVRSRRSEFGRQDAADLLDSLAAQLF